MCSLATARSSSSSPTLSGGTAEEDIDRIARLTRRRGVVSTWNTIGQSRRAPDRAARFLAKRPPSTRRRV